jgi:hypothetical protein
LATTISTGGSSSARAIKQARVGEVETADDLETAKIALATLKVDLEDLEAAAARADKAVDAALAETLKPVALRLLDEVHTHHVRFLTTQAALSALGRSWNSWDELVKQIDRAGSASEADVRVSVASRKEWEFAICKRSGDLLDMSGTSPPPEKFLQLALPE